MVSHHLMKSDLPIRGLLPGISILDAISSLYAIKSKALSVFVSGVGRKQIDEFTFPQNSTIRYASVLLVVKSCLSQVQWQ